MSDFTSGLSNNLIPDGNILNRKIDFQREKFLKGISSTKHGKKEDPTYIYFKFIFDFGNVGLIDPETFLAPSPLFRGDTTDYELFKKDTYTNIPDTDPNKEDKIREITDRQIGGFLSDIDFFYGTKAKIDDRAKKLFNINGGGLAYMGAQQFLAQRSLKRKQMLEAFKKGIDFINRDCPYYFQSLSGLDTLLKTEIKNYHKTGGALKRAGTLTIDCLESIDMRMFALAELYRKAIYDYTYHRIMLPENLRKFRMWLVITELRNIQLTNNVNDVLNPFSIPSVAQGANFLDSFNSQTGLLDSTQGLLQKSTNTDTPYRDKFGTYTMGPYAFVYQLDQCEFDFDSTYPSYATIDNKGGSAVTSQFKIHVGRVNDYKIQFNQLSDVIKKNDNIQQMVLSDIWGSPTADYREFDYYGTAGVDSDATSNKEKYEEYFAGLASKFILNTVGDLKTQGVSMLENKLLGNIYGFSGINIRAATSNVQSLVSTIDAGVPNPFAKNDPQSKGLGGPKERQYPNVNEDVYINENNPNQQNLGNVLGGSSNPTTPLNEDVYPNVPGSDLGLPNRTYQTNTSDEYPDVPGADLGVPNRVYPVASGDQYSNTPGSDLGLPTRIYPANNSDEYADVPGSDLGVPGRVYPNINSDQYTDTPGSDLGLPGRVYPSVNTDEYSNVPGSDLGVPNRVYTVASGDQYSNTPGSDLGLPDRQYPTINQDEYTNVPELDLGASVRSYPTINQKVYNPSQANYPGINEDEYPTQPQINTKNIGRIYTKS